MKKKLCYIISNIFHSNELEWTLEALHNEYELFVVLLNPISSKQYKDSHFKNYIKTNKIHLHLIDYNGKKDILKALISTFNYLKKEKPDITHAHLFDASLIGMTASYFAGIKHRIYTRHHSTYHHDYFPSAVKYDKIINHFATKIVAVSNNVYDILADLEKVSPHKIEIIYHGNNLDKIHFSSSIITELKDKYSLTGKFPVLGVLSRYINWKGIDYIIPAYQKLLKDFPNAKLVLAGTLGDSESIQQMLTHLPEFSYTEIAFEPDVWNLYKTFDALIHVPINSRCEAFGQVYIEAMQSKVPLICTLSGIANGLLVNEQNALICKYEDSESILYNMKKLFPDNNLKERIINHAFNDVQQFTFDKKIKSLLNIYRNMN